MERRKRNHSEEIVSLFKKKSKLKNLTKQAFGNLWTASDSLLIREYDALVDRDAHYYFTSPSVIKHCQNLKKLLRYEQKSSSNLSMCGNLKRKKKQLKMLFSQFDQNSLTIKHQNCKIIPYAQSLNQNSKMKISQIKKSLIHKIKNDENQHRQFLETQYNSRPMQKAQMRLVTTLEPLQSMNFIKKCHNYKEDGKIINVQMK